MNKLIVVSRYNEDISWINDYNDFNFYIYNKGQELDSSKYNFKNVDNIGGNQRDIFQYIVENYDNLPEYMIFIQAYPFDHCNKENFDKLINNNHFTALESYENIPESDWHKKYIDGGYMEINNSWYIQAHNSTHHQSCKYSSFDEFMNITFENYNHVDWIRFTPGSMYIIEKRQALYYPKNFWGHLMNILYKNNMTEAHIIERSLWYILQNNLQFRNEILK